MLDNVEVNAGGDTDPPSIGETAGCGGTDDDGVVNDACGDDVMTVGDGATMVFK